MKQIALWNPNDGDIRIHIRRGLRENIHFLPAKGVVNLKVGEKEEVRVSRMFKQHSLPLAEQEGLVESFT